MFQTFTLKQIHKFSSTKIQQVCLSDIGIFIAHSRRALTISHIDGCLEQIQLFHYFKQELNFEYQRCGGIAEIANYSKEKESCCFAIIMDFDLWCAIIRKNKEKEQEKVRIEVEQLKMLTMNGKELRFIEKERKNLLVLTQKSNDDQLNLVEVLPQKNHIHKFITNRCCNLHFSKQGQDPLQASQTLLQKNLLFLLYDRYVLIYNQLPSQSLQSHFIFVFKLPTGSSEEQEKTYADHILTLPRDEEEEAKLLVHVQIVPTEEKGGLQMGNVLSMFQVENGLQIVQSTFQNPNTTVRRHVYPNVHFSRFISSSIKFQLLSLKGLEYCLQTHSILLHTVQGLSLKSSLTLLSLPSTGSPKIVNQLQIGPYFLSLHKTPRGFWILAGKSLFYIHRGSKKQIYHRFVKAIEKDKEIKLEHLAKELQGLLE